MSTTYGDSPTRSRHTHSVEYRSMYVADSRRTLTRDIPAVPEVSLDTLMDAVLPTVPPDVLRRVCNLLVSNGCIQDAGSNSPRWACLPLDPTVAGAGENVVFRFLQNIADQIIALSMGHLSDTDLHLRINGNTVPLGSRHNLSRPDGYFQLGGPRTGTPDWGDIVMPMEFKNHFKKKNQIDDFSKVLWSMHHIMRNDPRRRYVHGLTCEDTNVRLWFHDRSDVFASEAFDVNKDWKRLVHIFLSMLLATRRKLGYDASMRIAPAQHQNSEPSYDIAIHNADNRTTTVYRTTGIISDVGADGMISRATRVWKVRKFENGQLVGPEHALKDVWVHKGRVAEDVLLGQIRRDQPEYADHFLTPLDSGYVPLDPSNPDVLDDTHHTLGRPRRLKPTGRKIATQDLPPSARSTLNQKASASKDSPKASVTRDSVGHSNDLPSSPQEGHRGPCRLSEHPRQHYRIVFKEVGIPIHELRKFTHIFAGIQGGFAGLHAIHLCNYVHRDVSSGNILLVPSPGNTDGGRGVIMDLEYAKAIDDNSAPYDVKTGTAAFMATEIALGRHHRLSTSTQPPEPDNSDDDIDSLVESAFPTGPIPKKSRPPPLRHNPLHDIESIWWLCVWMLFYLIHPEKGQKDGETQLQNYRRVFGTPESKLQFCDPDTFTLFTSHLSEEVSLLVHALMSWMGQIDRWFSRCYKRRDSPDSTMPLRIDSKTIKSSYDYGKRILDNLKRTSEQLPDYVKLSEHYQGPDPNDVASLMESSLHIDNEGLPLPEDSSPLGGAE